MSDNWTVVLPFFNEASFLPETLASLAAQTIGRFNLILVDNGSTDGSAVIAAAALAAFPQVLVRFLDEVRPGQIDALETGIAAVTTGYVAICDADTYYPPHYLAHAREMFDLGGSRRVAVMGLIIFGEAGSVGAVLRRYLYAWGIAPLLARQTHTGGYGQCFRTAALREVGGYSRTRWRHVLFDHELMNRIFAVGDAAYHPDQWCRSSMRRTARANVRWSLGERLVYHATPFAMKHWFFHRFLDARFTARRLDGLNLRRDRGWAETPPIGGDSAEPIG